MVGSHSVNSRTKDDLFSTQRGVAVFQMGGAAMTPDASGGKKLKCCCLPLPEPPADHCPIHGEDAPSSGIDREGLAERLTTLAASLLEHSRYAWNVFTEQDAKDCETAAAVLRGSVPRSEAAKMYGGIADALKEREIALRIFGERYRGGELTLAVEMGLRLHRELSDSAPRSEGECPCGKGHEPWHYPRGGICTVGAELPVPPRKAGA